jgi:7-keto-8-aminopelargonate synthetase-like enzyme
MSNQPETAATVIDSRPATTSRDSALRDFPTLWPVEELQRHGLYGYQRAWRMAAACQRRGLYVQAIPHPVVPRGLARLRAAVTAAHIQVDLDFSLAVLRDAAVETGVTPAE